MRLYKKTTYLELQYRERKKQLSNINRHHDSTKEVGPKGPGYNVSSGLEIMPIDHWLVVSECVRSRTIRV